jgi:hypothetical protein
MNNIQLATTLVAPTGTGKLFIPFSGGEHTAAFIESGAAGRPATLKFSRVLPKPIPSFPGVERMDVRLTEYFTVNEVEYSFITFIGTSVPVPIISTDRAAVATRLALIARDPTVQSAIASHLIPVG